MKNIENNLPFIQDHNQEVIDDFNSYNYNASERGLRRSEIRFLMGTQHFFLCPTLVTRRKKQNIFLWLQFSLTMSPHCGSLLSMVTGHFIGLLQIIIATDYIISLSNPVCKNCHEATNLEFFCFVLSLNMQKVLSLSNSNSFFSHLATYNSISRKLRQTDI